MANLIRSAKSGSDWGASELRAYNIVIQFEDAPTFFGIHDMPPPSIDQEVLTVENADAMASKHNVELINLLDLAMKPTPTEESAVDDFAVVLFRQLGYIDGHRVARTRKDILFSICGEWRHAKTDVCLLDRNQHDILLLVQEDKRYRDDPPNAQHQLVAEAIAAFDYNNRIREVAGLAALESKTMPGIVLIGTAPTFFKIPVTTDLVRHVSDGTYPAETTVVSAHVPVLPRPLRRLSEGMKPLDNRQAILRCYEAFKGIVGI